MTDKLPHNLLQLFAPRPQLRYAEPCDYAPQDRVTNRIGGVGQFMEAFREYKDKDGYVPTESWLEKKDRQKLEKVEKQKTLLTEGIKECMSALVSFPLAVITNGLTDTPKNDPMARGDAFKTLFVSRLSYDCEEKDLEKEFGRFGSIERVCASLITTLLHQKC